jgi:hypothetical protein
MPGGAGRPGMGALRRASVGAERQTESSGSPARLAEPQLWHPVPEPGRGLAAGTVGLRSIKERAPLPVEATPDVLQMDVFLPSSGVDDEKTDCRNDVLSGRPDGTGRGGLAHAARRQDRRRRRLSAGLCRCRVGRADRHRARRLGRPPPVQGPGGRVREDEPGDRRQLAPPLARALGRPVHRLLGRTACTRPGRAGAQAGPGPGPPVRPFARGWCGRGGRPAGAGTASHADPGRALGPGRGQHRPERDAPATGRRQRAGAAPARGLAEPARHAR